MRCYDCPYQEGRMTGERWGAFSVIDHIDAGALAADVLLYDRLVLPTPEDPADEERWKANNWQPDLQKQRIDVLGDIADPVQWDEDRRLTYQREMDRLRAEGATVNGFQLTGLVLAKERREVHVVAAYHSANAFHEDYP